jgi:predicted SnoaL-like aldol condensation-catalyzing enzyme
VELIMADGDMVMVRGRFSSHDQPAPWMVVDTIRMEDGLLKKHWDVVEDETSREASVSGLPMFCDASRRIADGLTVIADATSVVR